MLQQKRKKTKLFNLEKVSMSLSSKRKKGIIKIRKYEIIVNYNFYCSV